jgi:hypothetical protein
MTYPLTDEWGHFTQMPELVPEATNKDEQQ